MQHSILLGEMEIIQIRIFISLILPILNMMMKILLLLKQPYFKLGIIFTNEIYTYIGLLCMRSVGRNMYALLFLKYTTSYS